MDLTTTYMGLSLKNPLMVSSCPLSENLDCLRRMEDAGTSGIVLFSLFAEQLGERDMVSDGAPARRPSYFPAQDRYRAGPDEYLEHLRSAVEVSDIPILGSINGVTRSGWIEFASRMEEAGAAAIELNMYAVPVDPSRSGAEVEAEYLEVLRAVKAAVTVPVALKLNPYFSSLAHLARQCEDAGADGLVLFNRFLQPDLDLDRKQMLPALELSRPEEMRLPMMWISLLRDQVRCSLAGSTGVHRAEDLVKYVMAGADVAMVSSAILQNGIPVIEALLEDVEAWLDRHSYTSVEQLKKSLTGDADSDPSAYHRANYIRSLQTYDPDHGV